MFRAKLSVVPGWLALCAAAWLVAGCSAPLGWSLASPRLLIRREGQNLRISAPQIRFLTLTEYDETYGCPIVFSTQMLERILGEIVSEAGLKQLRIAETEKYPHVTYFFNGGIEKQYPNEDRVIVPSPKDVPTYDFKPVWDAIPHHRP